MSCHRHLVTAHHATNTYDIYWNVSVEKLLDRMKKENHNFWSLAYVDWNVDNQPTKEEAFDKLLTRIHPGAIVLLHSTSKTNGEILDELLTKWEEMGYTFAPLSELIAES